jgi:predicted PurR-regulated permease PerM
LLAHPLQTRLKGWGIPVALCSILVSSAVVLGGILPLVAVVFVLGRDAASLAQSLGDSGGLQHWMESPVAQSFSALLGSIESYLPVTQEELMTLVKQSLTSAGTNLLQWLGAMAARVPSLAIDFIVFLLALFFALIQGPRWVELAYKILPFDEDDEAEFFRTVEGITRGVVIGSLVVGFVQATLMTLAYSWTDLPRPFFFGFVTFLCSFVPFVGSGPIGIGGLIYLAARSDWTGCLILAIFFAVASLSDNFLRPLLMRGRAELHPLLAFVCVLGGLSAFGFAGLFLGPIFAALAVAAMKMLERRASSKA